MFSTKFGGIHQNRIKMKMQLLERFYMYVEVDVEGNEQKINSSVRVFVSGFGPDSLTLINSFGKYKLISSPNIFLIKKG